MLARTSIASRLKLALGVLAIGACCCETPEHVGSRDCAVLARSLEVPQLEAFCEMCQGQPCAMNPDCAGFPCEEGKLVLQGCEEDSDCAGLSMTLCALHTSHPHKICTTDGDAI